MCWRPRTRPAPPWGRLRGVEIVSGGTEAVDYLNNASYGLLTFIKEGASDSGLSGLSGARFALKKDGVTIVTATSNIDGSVFMSAPAGDYQLVETYAPAGFVRIDPVDVTIENGVTTDLGSVVDEASTASLTLTKYAVTYENGGGTYAAEDVKSIQTVADPGDFTFTLSWEEREGGVATPHSLENITLTSGGTVTLTGLKRVDADNNWIEYTLTEDAPADSAFARTAPFPRSPLIAAIQPAIPPAPTT
jgi:uncharacterized surface anchored protein